MNFHAIDGLEAGRVYRELDSPVTIGREEDNTIRINDERVSRFHAKVQLNSDRVILTDLESTNGTRVNGHPVRMRVLSIGDQISIGRCTLVYGSPEEVAALVQAGQPVSPLPSELAVNDPLQLFPVAYPAGPPELPRNLTNTQLVELSNLLDYLRTEILLALHHCQEPLTKDTTGYVHLPGPAWNRLKLLPFQLSHYLSHLADPRTDPETEL
jgi:hypothetical protein